MPYKLKADYNTWNRRYQRTRALQEDSPRVALRRRIVDIVRAESKAHDEYSLWEKLHWGGSTLSGIRGCVTELVRVGVLDWVRVPGENPHDYLAYKNRLVLTARGRKLFAPPADRVGQEDPPKS